jgi:hypothetical protein
MSSQIIRRAFAENLYAFKCKPCGLSMTEPESTTTQLSLCAGHRQTGALGKCHEARMSEDNGVPFTCHECGLLATRRGFEVRINDAESESKCKRGQNPNGCPSLKEAASIARQFAAIQGRA